MRYPIAKIGAARCTLHDKLSILLRPGSRSRIYQSRMKGITSSTTGVLSNANKGQIGQA